MDTFMRAAIEEALNGAREGGVPIGAVLVEGGRIIGRGRNRRVQDRDQLLHAEMDCLRHARLTGGYHNTILYSTLMPCYLCAGAVVQFGIKKVVVGEARSAPAALEFMQSHGIEVVDLDLRGTEQEVAARYTPAETPPAGRGRPKLGVVAREVTQSIRRALHDMTSAAHSGQGRQPDGEAHD